MKSKERTSILGLSFEGKSLSICLLRRRGSRPRVEKSLKVPLLLDPLSSEPELVGHEIRNQLDAAGIRERVCAVSLPLSWMLTLQTEVPDLAEDERDEYLALQAERAFPYAPEDLAVGTSSLKLTEGPGLATMIAISRSSLTSLQAVLKAAGLKPVLFTPGLAALPLPASGAILLAGDGGLDLAVYHAGGFALIRSLEEALVNGPEGAEWDCDLVARQLRISLGRLPQGLRETLRSVMVYGPASATYDLAQGLRETLESQGLAVREVQAEPAAQGLDPGAWTQAVAVAASVLLGRTPAFNLLPPHISRFKQLVGRISARGAVLLGGGITFVVVAVAAVFILQATRLGRLQAEWNGMKARVTGIEEVQKQVRAFRPWFESSAESLQIAARIASAFPEDGVWVKTIQFKDLNTVTCTCKARSDRDMLRLEDNLIKTPGIADVHRLGSTGTSPVQFNMTFRWVGGGSDAL